MTTTDTTRTTEFSAGEAIWIPASDAAVTLRAADAGQGAQVFVATV